MIRSAVQSERGFSLVELLVVIVVIGILAGAAMQSMDVAIKDARQIKTERELEMLAKAIVGDPSVTNGTARSDFGYVGDIGAFPSNLQALYQNPGGYSTWDGPYVPPEFSQDSTGFKTDEWGTLYSYSGGLTISSTGSGATISKKIADATGDYLLNTINGTIKDAANDPPGASYADSVNVVITIPNGAGSTTSKTYSPDAAGTFTLDSIPVGTHLLRLIYTPEVDTLTRYLTVLPRHKNQPSYRFASAHFGGGGGGSCSGNVTLRPSGAGSLSNLTTDGCGSNWQCVDETSSDDDATRVKRGSNSYLTDVYALENPADTSCPVTSVTVYCRARKHHTLGAVKPTVYVSGTEYNGSEQSVTTSYADYHQEWTTNPATSLAWTWQEVINLEAGLALKGQNAGKPGYCTQVWVVVAYSD